MINIKQIKYQQRKPELNQRKKNILNNLEANYKKYKINKLRKLKC